MTFGEAAAIPLVFITAYELLVERLEISTDRIKNNGKSILIIGGPGGVGSIAI